MTDKFDKSLADIRAVEEKHQHERRLENERLGEATKVQAKLEQQVREKWELLRPVLQGAADKLNKALGDLALSLKVQARLNTKQTGHAECKIALSRESKEIGYLRIAPSGRSGQIIFQGFNTLSGSQNAGSWAPSPTELPDELVEDIVAEFVKNVVTKNGLT